MREPTPYEILYRWHENALLGIYGGDVDCTESPECGWFKRRLVKHGPFVPAKIWMVQITDDAGDLIADELLQCEVNGEYRDPEKEWSWLMANPITEQEFNHLEAVREYAAWHAPEEPIANPRQPVDWLNSVPTPTF